MSNRIHQKIWPPDSGREWPAPVTGPCADTVGTRPPYGSGRPIRGNNVSGQSANHLVVGTRWPLGPGLTAAYASPWAWYSQIGTPGVPDTEPRLLQNCVRLLDFGGTGPPQTYVITSLACDQEFSQRSATPIRIANAGTPQAMSEGRVFTRLQMCIEWSTGTGTEAKIFMDIDQGVVFRVFGVLGRVWLLRYPGDGPDAVIPGGPLGNPVNVELPQTGPIDIPAGQGFTLSTVETSEQTNLEPQEGFPGSWQLTSHFVPGVPAQCMVPPFARRVQITQAPGGPATASFAWLDRTGAPVATTDPRPGTRATPSELVPSGARWLVGPPGRTSPTTIVWEVSQF
jgi:hypothetical protein